MEERKRRRRGKTRTEDNEVTKKSNYRSDKKKKNWKGKGIEDEEGEQEEGEDGEDREGVQIERRIRGEKTHVKD